MQIDQNKIKRLVIKIVNLLRFNNLKQLEKYLVVQRIHNKLVTDVIFNFSVPIISNNTMQTLIRLGYKIGSNERQIIDNLLLQRIALATVEKMLVERTESLNKIKNKNIETDLEEIANLIDIKPRYALYVTLLDLIPDFYFNKLDNVIKKLAKRDIDDYIFVVGSLILFVNINTLLQLININVSTLFSSRASYINATLITGLLTKYAIILQANIAHIINISNRLKKLEIQTNKLTEFLTNEFIPNLKTTVSEYQNISRTFAIV